MKKQGYIRLPKVSVYMTLRNLKKQLARLESLTGQVDKSREKLLELRIEGRINYHDWVKIKGK